MQPRRFGDVVQRAIILCYKEGVSALTAALEIENIKVQIQRPVYNQKELLYTNMSRCFLNHVDAWEAASRSAGYTLICEADFVPCRGLKDFPVFWPTANEYAWGYLYQGSPRLLALMGGWPFYLRGHTAPLVAYVINAPVARMMLKFSELEKSTYQLTEYFTFDAHLQWSVMGQGGLAFIPWRHYGEHGGLPNPEHRSSGRVFGEGIHHADNLMGPLHFLPPYAEGRVIRYWLIRMRWRALGLARLVARRWIMKTNVYTFSRKDLCFMYAVGFLRLIG